MDGNGRWAQKRSMPRIAGHRAGVENVRTIVQRCAELGIGTLSLFAFSSENWRRPEMEVSLLLELFVVAIEQEIDKLREAGVRLRVIGDRSPFSDRLRKCIEDAERRTAENTTLNLVIAANYGGHWDIVNASRELASRVASGEITPEQINERMFAEHVSLHDLPEPDLFIRSGGEQRVSNFLLWQLAYSEMFFTECLWPDFDAEHLELALADFQSRQRRFGMTGDQLDEPQGRTVGLLREE